MVFAGGMVGTLMVAVWGAEGWFRFQPWEPDLLTWHSTAKSVPRGVQKLTETRPVATYDLTLQAAVDFAAGERPS